MSANCTARELAARRRSVVLRRSRLDSRIHVLRRVQPAAGALLLSTCVLTPSYSSLIQLYRQGGIDLAEANYVLPGTRTLVLGDFA